MLHEFLTIEDKIYPNKMSINSEHPKYAQSLC